MDGKKYTPNVWSDRGLLPSPRDRREFVCYSDNIRDKEKIICITYRRGASDHVRL